MRPPSTAKTVQGLAPFMAQVLLGLFTFICFFGVIVNIVDEGGGASGREGRRVTVEQRFDRGLVCGTLGLLGTVAMVVVIRLGSPSPSLKKFAMDEL